MKRVEAIIRPERLSAVVGALTDVGCGKYNTTEVRSHGEEPSSSPWRALPNVVDVLPKTKVEVLVNDALVERVTSVIRECAFTGCAGDGTITIFPLEEVIDVQTGERIWSSVRGAMRAAV